MTYSEFKKAAQKLLVAHNQVVAAFPWEEARAYADWLAQTYYYVSYSTRLLAASAARLKLEDDRLHLRMLEHMGEEKSHQKLASTDMQKLGYKLEDFSELPETQAFYQTQFYWIEHQNPKALMGYILSLEVMAVTEAPAALVKIHATHPPGSDGFWRVHGEEDIEHVQKLYKQLESFSSEELDYVHSSLVQSCRLYQGMLSHIVERSARNKKGKLAA